MKTHFLFPASYRRVGWVLFVPGLVLGSIMTGFDALNEVAELPVFAIWDGGILSKSVVMGVTHNNVVDEIAVTLIVIGGMLTGFARTPDEDEFIGSIRYESLVWAMYFNFGLVLATTLFLYGTAYWYFMLLNIIGMLVFFVCRFHYKLYQLRKSYRDEE
ncbi:MAG TPA: hypothetical protein VK183_10870 [Flavobacterium sp.]|nr:hypothetical protein [Flavobacterium sp.]